MVLIQSINEIINQIMSGLMLEVGQGLQYIHSQKIVHRDIACRNILVDARQPGELTVP